MINKSIHLILTFIVIIWSTIRSGSNNFLLNHEEIIPPELNNEDNHTPVSYSYSQFHIMFSLASIYIANILTHWGNINIELGEGTEDPFKIGIYDSEISVWIKLCSSLSCYLFYLWVMIAPPLFPSRNFNN